MSTLAGRSAHAPGHMSGGSHSEWNAKAAALVAPSLGRGKWWSQVHAVTLSPRYFKAPLHQANQGTFYWNMHKKYIQECKSKAPSLFT